MITSGTTRHAFVDGGVKIVGIPAKLIEALNKKHSIKLNYDYTDYKNRLHRFIHCPIITRIIGQGDLCFNLCNLNLICIIKYNPEIMLEDYVKR